MTNKKNVGPADRYIRFLIGLTLFLNIIILEPGTVAFIILVALGLIGMYTSYSSYCILYDILKINTCEDICIEKPEKAES